MIIKPFKHNSIYFLFIAALAAVMFFSLLRDIRANDFFWHLKTGEWIWQHKSLPAGDPFSFTAHGADATREHFVLTSYWGSQILYYLLYCACGFPGIVLMRFVVMGLLIYFLLARFEKKTVTALCLTLLAAIILADLFATDRPQLFSFLFFAMLMLLLQSLKKTSAVAPYAALPLLMLVWANMHAGFAAGLATIAVYTAGEGIKFLRPSLDPMPKENYRKLVWAAAIALAVSLINPNTYHFLSGNIIFQPSDIIADSLDYQSPIRTFALSRACSLLIYWFFLFVVIAGAILKFRDTDLTELLLLLGIGFFSFTTVRYVPFFIIAGLPVVDRRLSELPNAKTVSIALAVIALSSAALFTVSEAGNLRNLSTGALVNSFKYPVDASEFIAGAGISGNMYNHFNWGGYLIWTLSPQRKVFIDGRILDDDSYREAMLINNAAADGSGPAPKWKRLLNKYEVNYVVIPIFTRTGDLQPLLYALLADSDWALVFYGFDSVIFMRDLPSNNQVLVKYAVQKSAFISELIGVLDAGSNISQVNARLKAACERLRAVCAKRR